MGVGIIGGALSRHLKNNHEVVEYDPPQGKAPSLDGIDAAFICVPVPTVRGRQDLSHVEGALNKLPKVPTFLRSTVLPGTADSLGVISCPEFLTQRKADRDMERLPVVMGYNEVGKKIFDENRIYFTTNTGCEVMKYAHNCFGAVKVNYFNMIYELCEKLHIDYEDVRCGVTLTNFINAEHTFVPGPDGKKGYGGKCLPKDLDAFITYLNEQDIPNSLVHTQQENARRR